MPSVCMSMRVACGHHHHHSRCGWWTRNKRLWTPKNDCLCMETGFWCQWVKQRAEAQSSTEKLVPFERPSAPGRKWKRHQPIIIATAAHCLLCHSTLRYSELNFGFSSPRQLSPLQVATPSATLALRIRPLAERRSRWCKQPSQSPRCSFKKSRALAEAAAADA